MSDASGNSVNPKYDGQIGMFGNWRDITAEELAYETKVRKIVGIVGGVFGALCILFSLLYAKGVLDGGVGLGMGIPSGVAASIMIPVGIFYNHGWHLRVYPRTYPREDGIHPLEELAAQNMRGGNFEKLKSFMRFYDYGSFDNELNLEPFVSAGIISVKEANFIRSHIAEYNELMNEINTLQRQVKSVPSNDPELNLNPNYRDAEQAKQRAYNEKLINQNAQLRQQNAPLLQQIKEKQARQKEIAESWNNRKQQGLFCSDVLSDVKKEK